jgi:glucose/arabinose dehydrogenase
MRVAIAAASTAVLISFGVGAQEGSSEVLSGDAAFGGWQDDAPGVTRHITVDDLVEPGATESASNAPGNVPMPEGAMPEVPDGFVAELVVSDLANPRVIRFAPNGDLFVANSEANEVRVYRFAEGGATPTEEGVFASENLNQPYGIAFYPPGDSPEWVYVANADGLVRFPYASGDLEASGAPETILEGIPAEHHWTRDIVFSPDGETIYYSVGSGSNVGENMDREPEGGVEAWSADQPLGASWGPEERRAAVLAFDPDGGNERYFATGLRNCSGMAIQPAIEELWCVVNERDGLGDDVPFDYATSVQEGAFYGWPWYYIGDNPDPRLSDTPREDLAGQVTIPDVLFQTHSAPLGIAFYDAEAFGAEYQGDAFVALHGSWNRETRTGYKVVRLLFDDSNEPTGEYQDFMTGFVVSDAEVWGRPVGVAVSSEGALFVSEDGSGTIWKVSKE